MPKGLCSEPEWVPSTALSDILGFWFSQGLGFGGAFGSVGRGERRAVQRDPTVVQLLVHGQQQCRLAGSEGPTGHFAQLADHYGSRRPLRLPQHGRKEAAGPVRLSGPGARLRSRCPAGASVRPVLTRDDVVVRSHHRSILPPASPAHPPDLVCPNSPQPHLPPRPAAPRSETSPDHARGSWARENPCPRFTSVPRKRSIPGFHCVVLGGSLFPTQEDRCATCC
jgi:hypothetical protein